MVIVLRIFGKSNHPNISGVIYVLATIIGRLLDKRIERIFNKKE